MPSVKTLLSTRGFYRYHALRQAMVDFRMSLVGSCIYIIVAASGKVPTQQLYIPLTFAVLCLWGAAFFAFSPEFYYRIRNIGYIIHFYVHHVLGQRHLLRAGVDLSRGLVVSPNPFLFLLSMILCRTVIWHFLNALMYRIRIDYFIVAIPFILLLGVGDEVELCERAASMHTGTAGVAYGYAVEFGRLASASLRPILPSSSSSTPMHTYTANSSTCTTESSSSNSTVARIASDCRLLHFYLLMLGGWLLPIYFILRLEHQVWYEYLNEDPANISWPGGPGVEEIAEGVEELRRQEERKRRLREAGSDWRMWLFFLVSAGVLWRLLDGVVNSERYSEIVWSWLL